ncbi:hypothetical protein MHK_001878 [Candidatus Magnetomorum sp. HK-1]|nr:hypothetical protein MHK_001878 [Candidatus Magnetomorum sp. HK-1]
MDSLFFMHSIKLIRYLIAWRVNTSLVRLPLDFSAEISKTLGHAIADRLSTKDARNWRKHLDTDRNQLFNASGLSQKHDDYPETPWPIHTIILPHNTKRNYGTNEIILWELKIIGDSADHGFFLEAILPAMEQLSFSEARGPRSRSKLWGHFDIQHIWIANGNSWDPLIADNQLNLRYNPKPLQWCSHFSERTYTQEQTQQKKLIWLTPFEFDPHILTQIDDQLLPDMSVLLESVIRRWSFYTSSRIKKDIWDLVPSSILVEVKKAWESACAMKIHDYNLIPAFKDVPGLWKGYLTYKDIPFFLLPYLDMAAILHVGKKTHYGCGTFAMSRETDDHEY